MPAKEEEVKKYRDAAIGNAAIVEGQTHHLGHTHHLDLKFPINRRLSEIKKRRFRRLPLDRVCFLGLTLLEVHAPALSYSSTVLFFPFEFRHRLLSTPNFFPPHPPKVR